MEKSLINSGESRPSDKRGGVGGGWEGSQFDPKVRAGETRTPGPSPGSTTDEIQSV